MTILEALQKKIGKVDIIEVVLLEKGLTGSDEYNPSTNQTQFEKVELARATILEEMAASATDFSEADLSIKYDRAAMRAEANRIRAKYGYVTDSQPKVKSKAKW